MSDGAIPIPAAVAVDLGDHAIKIAVLEHTLWPPWRPRLALTAWNDVPVPDGLRENGSFKDPAAAARALRAALSSAHPRAIRCSPAIAAIPDAVSFLKTLDLTTGPRAELDQTIREQAGRDVPLNLEESYLEYRVQPRTDHETRIQFGVVPKETVHATIGVLEQAGLVPFALEIESAAIVRSIESQQIPGEPVVVLDLGATRSSLIVAHQGAVVLTITLSIGGNAMTERIAKHLNIERDKAEELKQSCGLDPERCTVRIRPIIKDLLDELTSEMRRGLTAVKEALDGSHPRTIALVGGGSNIVKLENVLSRELIVKVRHADPAAGIVLPAGFPHEIAPSFATVLGLARASLGTTEHALHRPTLPFQKRFRKTLNANVG